MQKYESLILEKLGEGLTPKAKYERLLFLEGVFDRYKKTLDLLDNVMDWHGPEHPKYIKGSLRYT